MKLLSCLPCCGRSDSAVMTTAETNKSFVDGTPGAEADFTAVSGVLSAGAAGKKIHASKSDDSLKIKQSSLIINKDETFYTTESAKQNVRTLHLFGENLREFQKFDSDTFEYRSPTLQSSTQAIIRGREGLNFGVPNVCPIVTCSNFGVSWSEQEKNDAKKAIDASIENAVNILNAAYENGHQFSQIRIPQLGQGVAGLSAKSGHLADINNYLQEKLKVFNTVPTAGVGSVTVSAATVETAFDLPGICVTASAAGGAKPSVKAVGGAKPDLTEEVPFNYTAFSKKFTHDGKYDKSVQSKKVLRLVDPGTTKRETISTIGFLRQLRVLKLDQLVVGQALSALESAIDNKVSFDYLFDLYTNLKG